MGTKAIERTLPVRSGGENVVLNTGKDTLRLSILKKQLAILKPEGIIGNTPIQFCPLCFTGEERKAQEQRHSSKVPRQLGQSQGQIPGLLMATTTSFLLDGTALAL